MVKRRLFAPAGRGFSLALVVLLSACGTFDRVDASADKAVARVEVAADRALDAAASRAAVLVSASLTQAEAATGRMIDKAAASLSGVVERLPAALATGLKAQADAAASRATDKVAGVLPPEDRDAFRRDVEENGLLKALKAWWVEILASFFGAGGLFRAWLADRRLKREAALSRATVESVEEVGSQEVKDRVAVKTRSMQPSIRDAVNARVQEIVAKAIHPSAKK